jgi:hypothetical protein
MAAMALGSTLLRNTASLAVCCSSVDEGPRAARRFEVSSHMASPFLERPELARSDTPTLIRPKPQVDHNATKKLNSIKLNV